MRSITAAQPQPPSSSIRHFDDLRRELGEVYGCDPMEFAADDPETLRKAEEVGLGEDARRVIALVHSMRSTIDASVARASRAQAARLREVDRAERSASTSTPSRTPPLDWHELAKLTPPARQWAVRGWVGLGHTTLLVGPGGVGKTLLAQQLASALALGQPFIDEIHRPHKVLMWACEDDADELWRRQVAIGTWLEAGLDAFAENLHVVARHGLDNAIASTEFGRPMFTPRLGELEEQAKDLGSEIVILDNAAQIFGGPENDRHSVTFFLNGLAGALPGRAIVLLAHPARSIGSEFSGSSAWENTARTRLYLGMQLPDVKPGTDEGEPESDVRYLARRKANYSTRDYRRFNYRDQVLVPDAIEQAGTGIVGVLRDRQAERAVLDGLAKLDALGIRATEGARSPQFLPALLAEYKLDQGRNRHELGAAMRRLILDRRIEQANVGQYANRTPMKGLRVAAQVAHESAHE